MQLVVHDTPEATAHAIADRIAELSRESEDRFTLGLSGGSTPIPAYRILSGMTLDWERIDLWVSDERWVPPDHERSNGRMAAEVLAGPVGAWLYRPPWGEGMEPHEAAADYDGTIRNLMSGRRPDVIHLGVGDDGHTASLFPNTTALDEWSRWIVANWVPQQSEFRITATFPLIWSSRVVLVQAHGESKAAAVRDSFAGLTPAGRLGEGDALVEWHVDRAAADLIS
ncbi:MAG: 6-phosphogluconolactonase [Acidimicrobiales bacterium]|nr:6-phosphogluconolactonase [Acidimicrobiales bacterium]HLV91368.1 6-phosphogluconolactonase [Acidimicrobiia bacterium]